LSYFHRDSADEVISEKAEFETLIVASQEIGSATAQLVAASKVKARPDSEKMKQLLKSSRDVTSASGQIIAVTRNSSQLVRDQKEPVERLEEELRKLTVHQAKKREMESQLRIIQLEDQLNKERVRLAHLRKTHYHLTDQG
jgi:huntingtin interacting protein 1